MKKTNLLILCSLAFISCTNINQTPFQLGVNNLCSDLTNLSEKNIAKINVPDAIEASAQPSKPGYIQIEKNAPIYPTVELLKNDRFITAYSYANPNTTVLAGKIFKYAGEEAVSRFKIIDSKDIGYFKIITHKDLDYFFIFYQIKSNGQNNNQSGLFLKKFDLEGNQLNELKLENNELRDTSGTINFSFDQNGHNLILSWVTLKYAFTKNSQPFCPPFFSCTVAAIVPPSSYKSVVNIVKFDDKNN